MFSEVSPSRCCRRRSGPQHDHQCAGDQPFIDSAVIDAMALEFARRTPTPEVLTPIYRMPPE
jgi:hypothetical protein